MIDGLIRIVMSIVAALVVTTLHEVPKAVLAVAFGDDTPKIQGKLTLNPFKHVDPIGLIVMVASNAGWSYPVEFNPNNFRHKKLNTVIVALSGIVTSGVIGILALVTVGNMGLVNLTRGNSYVQIFLFYVALNSLGLSIINLVPITPFSITKIIAVFSPRNYFKLIQHERTAHILFLMLYFLGIVPMIIGFWMNMLLPIFM